MQDYGSAQILELDLSFSCPSLAPSDSSDAEPTVCLYQPVLPEHKVFAAVMLGLLLKADAGSGRHRLNIHTRRAVNTFRRS